MRLKKNKNVYAVGVSEIEGQKEKERRLRWLDKDLFERE